MLGWGLASLVVFFVLSLHRLIMHASFGSSRLRKEGKPVEDFKSARPDGGLSSLAAVVTGVLPVGYFPSPGKGKEKIREIRYPCGSEYLRVVLRYADVVGPSRVEPSFAKNFATRYRLLPGSESSVLIFLHLMLFLFPSWSASLRRPLRTTSAFPYTLSSTTTFQCMPVPTFSQFLGRLGRPSSFFQG